MRTAAFRAPPQRRGSGRSSLYVAALEATRRIPAFLRVSKRRKWVVVETVLLGALTATIVLLSQQPLYRADARVVLNPVAAHGSLVEANRLVHRSAMAREVLRRVRPGLTASELLAESSVSSPARGIVEYHVRDKSPARAAALATAYAREFSRQVGEGRVLAATGTGRVGAGAARTIAFGAGAGLVLGMIVAVLWNAMVFRWDGRRHATTLHASAQTAALTWIAPDETLKGELEPMSSNKQKLATDVSALEEEFERLRARLDDSEGTLEALERQRAEVAGTVMNARRTLSDLEERLTERRQALGEAEREEARRTLEAAVAERDGAAMQLAETVGQALDDIDSLEAARAAVGAIHQTLIGGSGRTQTPELSPEPVALAEAWDRLVARIRIELDQNLEDNLLEAAARSPLGYAIDELPAHLRAAARQRRRALMGALQARERDDAGRDRSEQDRVEHDA
jgi:capsular polysaccharide biosynthesis protein